MSKKRVAVVVGYHTYDVCALQEMFEGFEDLHCYVQLLEQFLDWLDGGPAMETNVEDNLKSMALVSAAIQSSRCGRPVRVQEKLGVAADQ